MAAAVAVAAIPIGLAEMLHWRASRRLYGEHAHVRRGERGAQVVLVLGFPATRHGELHPLQRWRTEMGVRSLRAGADSRLIFSGGGPPGIPTEAETMAAYARDVLGVPAAQIVVETAATSTWENVGFSVPWLESARTIAIVSDPLHAARGRRYLHRQRPDLAARLVPADDYRPFERLRLKVPTAVYAVTRPPMRRLRARLSGTPLAAREVAGGTAAVAGQEGKPIAAAEPGS
ncbi:YdcF family protein [Candidatus Frankia nodulisporulans]|uniref:YdcF family protein n=1 Tax=Candidatus Frankia nodulisporulans TaxID=2060052 RepID=UPI001CDBA29C|nr:YdcF family protein [Candidatus Frankia nodulisporulans]